MKLAFQVSPFSYRLLWSFCCRALIIWTSILAEALKADLTLRNVCRPSDRIDDLVTSTVMHLYNKCLWLLNPHVYAASRCFLHCDRNTPQCRFGCRTCNGDCSILPQHECPICMVSVSGHLCSICKTNITWKAICFENVLSSSSSTSGVLSEDIC